MKKILIITYYWPPSGGAGVQRWLKFTKYLPDFDWQPVILTVDPAYATYPQRDNSLQDEINPMCLVYTCKSFEFYNFYRVLLRKKEVPYGGFANESRDGFFQKAAKFLRGNFFLPDPRRGWNKYAIKKAEELIRKYHIETVITTSPPHSTQLIGLKLKQRLGIRWIADFRDPWTDIYYYKKFKQTAPARLIDRRYERKVIEGADLIITVSQDFKRLFSQKSNQNVAPKIHIVPNGFDPTDFDFSQISNEAKFVITYIGTISDTYDIDGFIKALSTLSEVSQSAIKIRVVGRISSTIEDKLVSSGIETELIGYVEHSKSVDYLLQSSLLLLVVPKVENNRGIVPGKFFEYLASRKPILALGPVDSDMAGIIRETQSGVLLAYDDSAGITNFIATLLNQPHLKVNDEAIVRYSRKYLTKEIAALL